MKIYANIRVNMPLRTKTEVGGHGHEKIDTGAHVHVTDMVMDMDTR